MVNAKRRGWLAADLALLAAVPLARRAAAANPAHAYVVIPLVSNGYTSTPMADSHLVNGWGIAAGGGPIWVSNNGTGTSTLYDGNGTPQTLGGPEPLVVNIPAPGGGPGAPTGTVFNGGSDFVVTQGAFSGPARFIFVTEDGTIAAWAPNVDFTNAILQYTDPAGAIYKGLAIGSNADGNFLYANDFHNGRVAVFDENFVPVTLAGAFVDPHLPRGYAPFGIQNLEGSLYVAYAKQDADAEDEVAGQGLGVVNQFDTSGHLLRRVASRGQLNAPWGLAIAPDDFGRFSNALLVGNFGDGRINAFDVASGELLGPLRDANSKRIVVDGLWGIRFGNGNAALNEPANVLFFAAGPNDESDGLFGRIEALMP